MRRALFALVLIAAPCHAQQITADRPGIGIDPEVVPQGTLQPELGSDGKEVRLGLLNGLEADWQAAGGDSAEGIKLRLIDRPAFKASLRLAHDQQLHGVIEVPANVTVTPWFNFGADAMLSRTSKVYAAEFNFQPTGRLTITPTLYHDGRPRAALFAAWMPPGHDNVQFDIGWDQGKISVGISTALDFSKLLRAGLVTGRTGRPL